MRLLIHTIIPLVVGLLAAPVLPAAAGEVPDGEGVAALVRRLGDENFAAREQANKELAAMGELAEKELRKHRSHEDPEVRLRVQALIDILDRDLQWIDPKKEGTPACRSGTGIDGVKLTFKNLSSKPVRLFWLEWDGSRRSWRDLLAPGATAVCERSFKGHFWLVSDAENVALGIYRIDRDDPVIVVRDEDAEDAEE